MYSLSFSVCLSVSLSSLSSYLILCASLSQKNALSYCFFYLVEQILELVFNIKSSLFQQNSFILWENEKETQKFIFDFLKLNEAKEEALQEHPKQNRLTLLL